VRSSAIGSLVLLLALGVSGCADDGAGVTAAGSGSRSAAGSGSGSGLAAEDLAGGTDDPLITKAVADYRAYVVAEVDRLVAASTTFTDAVRAGDLAGAKAAYAPSRVHWETIEPIAGLVEDLDGRVDARVDDMAWETDPAWTGWHRIEYLLWVERDTAAATPYADRLDGDLATLRIEVADLELPPKAVALGAAELVEEVSEGKITGEEDRYSGTDLWDFAANVDGAAKVVELLSPALAERDADLLADVEAGFADVRKGLAPYADGDGWKPYAALTAADRQRLAADLGALAEHLARVSAALGLR
jgi:iron uptake system component EfeO